MLKFGDACPLSGFSYLDIFFTGAKKIQFMYHRPSCMNLLHRIGIHDDVFLFGHFLYGGKENPIYVSPSIVYELIAPHLHTWWRFLIWTFSLRGQKKSNLCINVHRAWTFCTAFAYMMTSSNGNIFRVTDPLHGEFTGHRWIPLTEAGEAEL